MKELNKGVGIQHESNLIRCVKEMRSAELLRVLFSSHPLWISLDFNYGVSMLLLRRLLVPPLHCFLHGLAPKQNNFSDFVQMKQNFTYSCHTLGWLQRLHQITQPIHFNIFVNKLYLFLVTLFLALYQCKNSQDTSTLYYQHDNMSTPQHYSITRISPKQGKGNAEVN